MALSKIYKRIVLLSPRIEIAVRCFYWNNVKHLRKFRKSSFLPEDDSSVLSANFEKVIDYLKECGIKKGDILVIHSSYGNLRNTGLKPEEIIDKFVNLVGDEGTIAMPAIREFPEEVLNSDYILNYINNEMKDIVTTYDIYKSQISSGLLPFALMRYDDAICSEFPLNPIVALGAEAKAMMEENIKGCLPTAHGPNSAWAYCAKRNAWNLGIGVDIKDYLTIFHTSQEVSTWPIKDWFFERNFIIKKGKSEKPLRINERKHKWTKYFAEANFFNDLKRDGVLKYSIVDGIPIYATISNELFNYIDSQENPSYPYFVPKKYR